MLRQNFFFLVILLLPEGGLVVFLSLRLAHHTLEGRAGAYTEPRPGQSEPAPRPSEAQGSPSRAEGWSPSIGLDFLIGLVVRQYATGASTRSGADAVPF